MSSAAISPVREPWVTRESLGLAVIFAGQPLGWALRGGTGGGDSPIFPVATLLIGMLLMTRSRWIFSLKLYSDPVLFAIPVFLMLVPFVLMSLTNLPDNLQIGGYTGLLVVVMLCVALNPASRFDTLPRALMIIGFLSSLDPFIELLLGNPADQLGGRLALSGNSNVLLTGSIGGITMISAALVGDDNKGNSALVGLLASVAFVTGLGALVLSDKRSDEFIMFAIAGLYLLLRTRRERVSAKSDGAKRQRLVFASVLIGGVAALPAIATLFFSKYALLVFEATSEARHNGFFNSFSGGSYTADTSTNGRFATIEFAYKHLDFIGHGMMHQTITQGSGIYTHLAYLQAFYDMGILGGFMFALVTVVIPVALIYMHVRLSPVRPGEMLVILLFFYVQGDVLTHGAPYSWTSLLPCLLCYLLFFGQRYDSETDENPDAEDAIGAPAA
jgi:hypothetical protein